MVLETIPSHPQVLARTVLVGTFPRLDLKPSLSKDGLNFLFGGRRALHQIWLLPFDHRCKCLPVWLEEWLVEERGGGIFDECLEGRDLWAGCIVSWCTVSKGDCAVSKISPGRVWSRGAGEGVGWNTDNPEVGVLVAGGYRSEELLNVVDGVVGVESGSIRMPLRLGTFAGAVWVKSLRLSPDSVRMKLSVVILTLVEVLVLDTMQL